MKAKKSKKKSMSYRIPADMHADGVYFNEQLLALKKQQEFQQQKLKSQRND